ncbi:MAG: nucleotide exchange factor GrpE [Candidatus Pacebacteria bacterium]|nr:nucleotide exchange factor GrpE [Candidatus Paceibacterota bacterium]
MPDEIINDEISVEKEDEFPKDKLKKLKEELKKCEKEKEEYLLGWQRSKADFINARKDEEKRREEFVKFANSLIIYDIIPVLDSLELAFSCFPAKEQNKHGDGIRLIKLQIENVLKKYGLKEIKSLGETFNPEFHESVGEIESDKESGAVAEEIQKGYILNGKILRPAKVKLAK